MFRHIVGELLKAGLPPEGTDQLSDLTPPLHDPQLLRSVQIELAGLRIQIGQDQTLRTEAQLATIEQPYRQALIDQFDKLSFRGLSPTRLIELPLERIYVELNAVADIPTDADTYSAEERRLLAEAEARGEDARTARAYHLDALQADQRKQQARTQSSMRPRRSIQEILDDPLQRGVVILGDPGSGKTTLLHYHALRAARTPRRPDGSSAPLPIFVPLAAYDEYLSHQPGTVRWGTSSLSTMTSGRVSQGSRRSSSMPWTPDARWSSSTDWMK